MKRMTPQKTELLKTPSKILVLSLIILAYIKSLNCIFTYIKQIENRHNHEHVEYIRKMPTCSKLTLKLAEEWCAIPVRKTSRVNIGNVRMIKTVYHCRFGVKVFTCKTNRVHYKNHVGCHRDYLLEHLSRYDILVPTLRWSVQLFNSRRLCS